MFVKCWGERLRDLRAVREALRAGETGPGDQGHSQDVTTRAPPWYGWLSASLVLYYPSLVLTTTLVISSSRSGKGCSGR